jgi:hypothetical protein
VRVGKSEKENGPESKCGVQSEQGQKREKERRKRKKERGKENKNFPKGRSQEKNEFFSFIGVVSVLTSHRSSCIEGRATRVYVNRLQPSAQRPGPRPLEYV